MTDLNRAIEEALACFRRLDEGKTAPTVVVVTEGQHVSASWVEEAIPQRQLPSAIALRKHVKLFRFW